MIMGWEDGIVKDEFLHSFGNLRDSIDKWSLVCLFYHLDYDDQADEKVALETVVKIICATKGVAYQKPGVAATKATAAPPTQGILKNKPAAAQQNNRH